ncbi:MAG TPA: ATP-dependent DNA ligase [Archaeoglobaceae archaeon]|nr:ATP-dependent DNA ligase [Archaeoglobaceae archaeon]
MLKFQEFANFCLIIEKISSTLELADKISEFMKNIDDENDLYNAVLFLMGRIYPPWDEREVGVGVGLIYEALRMTTGVSKTEIENVIRDTGDLGISAERILQGKKQTTLFEEELTLGRLRDTFDSMSSLTGERSQKKKIRSLVDLFISASPLEARYLTRLLLGEMRLGVGEGIIRDSIAKAWSINSDVVERAYMIINDFGRVAMVARREGEDGLKKLRIQLHVPVRMMLAQVAEGIEKAIEEMGEVAVEWKFDGSRVQVHWGEDKITIFSRRLENVTNALPEIVDQIKKSVKENVILDGEVIAMKNGRPMPFQHILRRFRRKYEVSRMMEKIPITAQFFDILYADGRELIDLPLEERRKVLESYIKGPDGIRIAEHVVTSDPEKVKKIYNSAIKAGHEGAMLKNPASTYTPGKRGKNWLKLKAGVETLDLVVVGGEWGEGKRSHLISSYELACVDQETGKLVKVGKVATGFTEEQLEEFTELFRPLVEYEEGKKMVFKPEIIFEVGYQEIQKSPKYEGGYALRFPRFVRLRDDKDVEEADTIERVAHLYETQFK